MKAKSHARRRRLVTRFLAITAILALAVSCAPDPKPQRARARAAYP